MRRLRRRDAINLSLQRTRNTWSVLFIYMHTYMPRRKVNILPKLFSLFCICWTAEAAEAPPCNPEPGSGEQLSAGKLGTGFVSEGTIHHGNQRGMKRRGSIGQQNTGDGAKARRLLPSGVTRRVSARLLTTGAVYSRRCRQRMIGRQRDASSPRRRYQLILLATHCTLLR